MSETDVDSTDGSRLHVYDSGGDDRLAVVWHHGTPNIGAPPVPLFETADTLGIRWASYDRPGYGGSTPRPGRDLASAAEDVTGVVDALDIDRFAVMGHSGGGPNALSCGALLPDRVLAVVSVSGLAPYSANGLDWFADMAPGGQASLRAALDGRAAKERHEATATDDDPGFIAADEQALTGDWSWFLDVVRPALAQGPGGLIDDDLAAVGPWGFDPGQITVPVVILHGGRDRVVPSPHGEWLVRHCRSAELWLRPDAGHISVLGAGPDALRWLRQQAP
ncbi:MAG: alpha/beta fold hydrolase [Nocardioidaceae bacterium]